MNSSVPKEQLTPGGLEQIRPKPSPDSGALKTLMDALADEVLYASDEEILAEVKEEGLDPAEEANEVRRILTEVVDEMRKGQPALSVIPLKT